MRNKNVLTVAIILVMALVIAIFIWVLSSDRLEQNEDKLKTENTELDKPSDDNSDDTNSQQTKQGRGDKKDDVIGKLEETTPEIPEVVEKPKIDEVYTGTGKIFGKVITEDKQLSVNAKVQLLDFAGTLAENAKIILELQTDTEGAFEFDGIIDGQYKVVAFIEDFGFETSELIKLRKDEEKYVEIKVEKGFRLFGTVQNAEKQMIESAEISCTLLDSINETFQAMNAATTKSYAEGEYELKGLKAGSYWVQVTHEAYATTAMLVILQDDTEKDFELAIGGAIHGTVRDEQGEPVTKFRARCFLDSDDDLNRNAVDKIAAQYKAFESEIGEFLFTNLAVNKYAVEILAESYAQTVEKQIKVDANETTKVEITLTSGFTLKGVVLEKETDKPIENAKVSIAETIDIKQGEEVIEYPFFESKELTAVTDSNGKFSISGLPGKTVHVWISHENFPQVRERINFAKKTKDEYKFYMVTESSTVYGKVYDENEQPVKGRMVLIQKNGTSIRRTGTSDENGEYKIDKVAPGEYLIILLNKSNSVDELASFSIKKGENLEINFGIEEGIKISGKVTKNGEPIKARNITFSSLDKKTSLKITTTSEDGSYKGVLSEPGKYTVLIQGYDAKVGKATTTRFEINVPDVLEHVENFEIPENSIQGIILSESTNEPVIKCFVSIESMSSKGSQDSLADIANSYSGQSFTNKAGEFKISEVTAGRYRLKIVANTFAAKIIENIDLSSGGIKDMGRIYLKPETKITGFVTDESGSAIVGAVFVVSNSKGQSLSGFIQTRSGKDGKFEITGLSQDSYTIMVYAEGFARKTLPTVKIGMENEVNLNVTLQKGTKLTVTVKDLKGKMLKNVEVTLYGARGVVKPIFKGLQDFTPLGVTDITGKCVRKSLAPGLYTVVVSKKGFETQHKKISLSSGLDSELDFILYND